MILRPRGGSINWAPSGVKLRDFQSTSLATGAGADANRAWDKEHSLPPDKLDVASTCDENQQVNVKLRAGLLILALVAVVAGRPTVVQAFGVPRAN